MLCRLARETSLVTYKPLRERNNHLLPYPLEVEETLPQLTLPSPTEKGKGSAPAQGCIDKDVPAPVLHALLFSVTVGVPPQVQSTSIV